MTMLLLMVFTGWSSSPGEDISVWTIQPEAELPGNPIKEALRRLQSLKDSLALHESSNVVDTVNLIGAEGLWQFTSPTKARMVAMGIDTTGFLRDSLLQSKCMDSLLIFNRRILVQEIAEFSGKQIKGIMINETAILGAAHLAGPYGVKKWFSTAGAYNPSDSLKTKLEDYLRKYSDINLKIN